MGSINFGVETNDEMQNSVFVNFNQDSTSLAIGTKTGYKLYALTSTDKLDLLYEDVSEDIRIVERLFSSSLLAIVSLSSPRKLKVCHFKKKTEICNNSYANTILAVKLNRQRLIVCLEESIYIHNIRDMKLLHTIKDMPSNPNGLCALSPNSDNCYFAYPANNTSGEVNIFDAENLQNKVLITAHDNPLAAIAFDSQGVKIATASEKGTVIRVFNVVDGQSLYEFRRGYARCVTIYSLSFSSDSLFLCASSNTETVHIFKLEDLTEIKPTEEPKGLLGYISTYGAKALQQTASYWPSMADMMNQWRSFATAKLSLSGPRNVCSVANIQKVPRVLIASADGYLYIYDLNVNEGGDCTLIKQHRLDETIKSAEASNVANNEESSPQTSESSAPDYDGEFPPMTYSPGF
ncbi:WD repeat domain phosphoinositide-interacting protein 2-like [Oppia nitens]|uniref:WD repeat domain phosphoinositide-interacting protein 2-like n=1 Tax=Oppia nitens TaxID=1686743 RepID=UPI0023DC30C4|nr:WD repeat domain phosphoinositide-interacting protein 2-like [Oppia nitens]